MRDMFLKFDEMKRNIPIVFFLILCCQKPVQQNFSSAEYEIFPLSFPIELGQLDEFMASVSGLTLVIASKDGRIFELDVQKGLKEITIQVEGKVKQVVQNYIVAEEGNFISVYSTSGEKKYEFPLDTSKYFFISPSDLLIWKDGKFFNRTATSDRFLFAEEKEPRKIFGFRFAEKGLFVVWNSEKQSWWWNDGVKKRLGQYTEKEELYFYQSEGSYVAISTKDALGLKQNVRLLYGENQEIKDFSVELTSGYAVIRVPKESFPSGPNMFIIYDVIPQNQDDFLISASEKEIFFLDFHETHEGVPKLCSVYLGRYVDGDLRREDILPVSSCKAYISGNSLFFSASVFSESFYQSFLFVFWNRKLFKREIFYDEAYPIFISDIPYIYLIIYDREKKTWKVDAEPLSFW